MAILDEPVKGTKVVKNYINGEWVDSKGKSSTWSILPRARLSANVPVSTAEERNRPRSQPPRQPFPIGAGPPLWPGHRLLFRLKELMEENFEEVSRIQTQEHGKMHR